MTPLLAIVSEPEKCANVAAKVAYKYSCTDRLLRAADRPAFRRSSAARSWWGISANDNIGHRQTRMKADATHLNCLTELVTGAGFLENVQLTGKHLLPSYKGYPNRRYFANPVVEDVLLVERKSADRCP